MERMEEERKRLQAEAEAKRAAEAAEKKRQEEEEAARKAAEEEAARKAAEAKAKEEAMIKAALQAEKERRRKEELEEAERLAEESRKRIAEANARQKELEAKAKAEGKAVDRAAAAGVWKQAQDSGTKEAAKATAKAKPRRVSATVATAQKGTFGLAERFKDADTAAGAVGALAEFLQTVLMKDGVGGLRAGLAGEHAGRGTAWDFNPEDVYGPLAAFSLQRPGNMKALSCLAMLASSGSERAAQALSKHQAAMQGADGYTGSLLGARVFYEYAAWVEGGNAPTKTGLGWKSSTDDGEALSPKLEQSTNSAKAVQAAATAMVTALVTAHGGDTPEGWEFPDLQMIAMGGAGAVAAVVMMRFPAVYRQFLRQCGAATNALEEHNAKLERALADKSADVRAPAVRARERLADAQEAQRSAEQEVSALKARVAQCKLAGSGAETRLAAIRDQEAGLKEKHAAELSAATEKLEAEEAKVVAEEEQAAQKAAMSKRKQAGRGRIEMDVRFEGESLRVTVQQGEDLLACDLNGLSDPFVKVQLVPGADKATTRKTAVAKRTLSPVWGETLEFQTLKSGWLLRDLLISVWDWDRVSANDFMGAVKLNVAAIKEEPAKGWFSLLSEEEVGEQ